MIHRVEVFSVSRSCDPRIRWSWQCLCGATHPHQKYLFRSQTKAARNGWWHIKSVTQQAEVVRGLR